MERAPFSCVSTYCKALVGTAHWPEHSHATDLCRAGAGSYLISTEDRRRWFVAIYMYCVDSTWGETAFWVKPWPTTCQKGYIEMSNPFPFLPDSYWNQAPSGWRAELEPGPRSWLTRSPLWRCHLQSAQLPGEEQEPQRCTRLAHGCRRKQSCSPLLQLLLGERLLPLHGDTTSARQGTRRWGAGNRSWVKLTQRGGNGEREKPVSFNPRGFPVLLSSSHTNAHSLIHRQKPTPAQKMGSDPSTAVQGDSSRRWRLMASQEARGTAA